MTVNSYYSSILLLRRVGGRGGWGYSTLRGRGALHYCPGGGVGSGTSSSCNNNSGLLNNNFRRFYGRGQPDDCTRNSSTSTTTISEGRRRGTKLLKADLEPNGNGNGGGSDYKIVRRIRAFPLRLNFWKRISSSSSSANSSDTLKDASILSSTSTSKPLVENKTVPPTSSSLNFLLGRHPGLTPTRHLHLHFLMKNKIRTHKEKLKEAALSLTPTENIWTIPNILCFMRIGMSPLLAYMIVNSQFAPAVGVFAVAGITDLLDGWIARMVPGQSSVMGSFLDPMADKILVGTLFLSLTYMDLIPVPLTSLIIGRDAILLGAGFWIRYQSLDPPRTLSRYFNITYPTAQLAPTTISKINTGVQLFLVGATLVSTVLPYDVHRGLEFLWYFTASTTIASAIGYVFAKDTVKLLKKQKQQRASSSSSKSHTKD